MHLLDKFKYCPACGSDRFVESDEKSKQCLRCGFKYYLNAVSAVAAFVVDNDNRLLLCRRANDPAKGTWDLPGGFVDPDETAEEAITREIYEELGFEIESFRYLFSIPNEYYYSGFNVRTLDMFYLVQVVDDSKPIAKDDVESAEFIPMDSIDISTIGLKSIKVAVEKFLADYISQD